VSPPDLILLRSKPVFVYINCGASVLEVGVSPGLALLRSNSRDLKRLKMIGPF
jgi:hypothetical protein